MPYMFFKGVNDLAAQCFQSTSYRDIAGIVDALFVGTGLVSGTFLLAWLGTLKLSHLGFQLSAQICKFFLLTAFLAGLLGASALGWNRLVPEELGSAAWLISYVVAGLLMLVVVSMQVTAMWLSVRTARTMAEPSDLSTQRAIRWTKLTALLTVGSFLSVVLALTLITIAKVSKNPLLRFFSYLALSVDTGLSMMCVLLLSGMVGPRIWAQTAEDAFRQLADLAGYALQTSKRVAFEGKINDGAKVCVCSFPGKSPSLWDVAVEIARCSPLISLSCVFLTNVASGLGKHEPDPDNPGHCYCKTLYGSVSPVTYISFFEEDRDTMGVESYEDALKFRMDDAKAMGQIDRKSVV